MELQLVKLISFYYCSVTIFRLSRELHEKLQRARRKLDEHSSDMKYGMVRQILDFASVARSILHKKMREYRASVREVSHSVGKDTYQSSVAVHSAASAKSLIPEPQSAPSIEAKPSLSGIAFLFTFTIDRSASHC
jgi:hypothetical protein